MWGLHCGILLVCFRRVGCTIGSLRTVSRHWSHCCCPCLLPQPPSCIRASEALDKAQGPEAESPCMGVCPGLSSPGRVDSSYPQPLSYWERATAVMLQDLWAELFIFVCPHWGEGQRQGQGWSPAALLRLCHLSGKKLRLGEGETCAGPTPLLQTELTKCYVPHTLFSGCCGTSRGQAILRCPCI